MTDTDQHAASRMSSGSAVAGVVPLPQALGERIDIHPTVQSLKALILAAEAQMDQDRRLPDELVEALEFAGMFKTIHPREFGGLELHPLDYLDFVFELARINGSVAWIAIIQNGQLHLLEPPLMQELYDRGGGRFVAAGSHGRIGEAYPVEGGYRLYGHWAFASGAPWANFITAYATIMGDDGEPLKDPLGRPMYVDAVFAREEVDFIADSWRSMGMRGTASGQFRLDGAFCERRLVSQMTDAYHDRALFRGGGAASAGAMVPLGIAQGAIDRFMELANANRRKNSWGNRANSLGDEQLHQIRIAHADAMIRAARVRVTELSAQAYDEAFEKDAVRRYDRMVMSAEAGTFAARAAKEAVNLVFDIAGTDSVIEGKGIERCFRDVHTCTQHSLQLENTYAAHGQYLLTKDLPGGPFITDPNSLLPPPPPKGADARVWLIDDLHSSVGFRIRHRAVGTFRAYFSEFSGRYDSEAGTFSGSVKVDSLRTNQMLKEHLLGDDFLAAEAYPEITFESSSVEIDGDAVTIVGDLTMKGVTKSITATGVVAGPSSDKGFGEDTAFLGIDVQAAIDRRDFGIAFNNELLDGQLNLGWDVTLDFALELSRPIADD